MVKQVNDYCKLPGDMVKSNIILLFLTEWLFIIILYTIKVYKVACRSFTYIQTYLM